MEAPCTGSSGCCASAACASRSPRRWTRCGAPAQPGVLRDRELSCDRAAGRAGQGQRDEPVFDEIFDAFFSLVRVGGADAGHGHGHGHEDLVDDGRTGGVHAVRGAQRDPGAGPRARQAGRHPGVLQPEDLAQQYNLHQEANKIDLAALTDEIVFSKDDQGLDGEGYRVQIETDRLHGAGPPGKLSPAQGTKVDADLTIAEQEALLGWLNEVEELAGRVTRTTPRRCAGG